MFKKAIEANMPPPGTFKPQVFDTAYASRLKALKAGYDTPYWNKKVFANTRDLLGGRVRLLLTGSATSAAELIEFISVVFGPVISFWGMTESCCEGTASSYHELSPAAGSVLERGCEFKLIDAEGYTVRDQPHPQGEICLHGPFMFKGYYKQPAKTAAVSGEDGWYRTGDIGAIMPDGQIAVVGRITALIKNALGEFIAVELLESIYRNNQLLQSNSVCVVVHPHRNYICAIAITEERAAMRFADAHSIKGEWPAVLERHEFQAAAARSLAQTAKDSGRAPMEWVRHARVLNEEWTPDNGLMTAAQKLKRREIASVYSHILEELFSEP